MIDDPDKVALQVILQAAEAARRHTGMRATIYIGPPPSFPLPTEKIAEYKGIDIVSVRGVKADIRV